MAAVSSKTVARVKFPKVTMRGCTALGGARQQEVAPMRVLQRQVGPLATAKEVGARVVDSLSSCRREVLVVLRVIGKPQMAMGYG